MDRRRLVAFGILVLALCLIIPIAIPIWVARHKVVHVVLIAGGDNVEGFAQLDSLSKFMDKADEETLERFAHLRDEESGNWTTRDDVFVFSEVERHQWHIGNLNIHDYGSGPGLFGPEVEVGHVLGDAFDNPVVLVKAGYTHKSLAVDWLSPSRAHRGKAVEGYAWIHTLRDIKYALKHVNDALGPEYKRHRTQLVGMIWWNGHMDVRKRAWLEAYDENQKAFVRDFRKEMDRPHLPLVVAVSGMGGEEMSFGYEKPLREAQYSLCHDKEFRDQTKCVETARFVHDSEEHLDRNYHYYGHGDTMIEIGGVLGDALVELYYRQYETKELRHEIEADCNAYVDEAEFSSVFVLLVCFGMTLLGMALYRRRYGAEALPCNRFFFRSSAALNSDADGLMRSGRRRKTRFRDEEDDAAASEMTPTRRSGREEDDFESMPAHDSELVELDELDSSEDGDE